MKRFSKIALLVLAGWAVPAVAAAQTTGAAAPRVVSPVERERMLVEQVAVAQGGRLVASVEARTTPGRPYSAEAVTESLQVLGDGNRISKRTVTRVYRDNDGRTRREQVAADGTVQSITISDPVGGANYVLNPATKTASQSNILSLNLAVPPAGVPVARGGGGGAGTGAAVGAGGGAGGGRGRGTAVAPTGTPPDQDARREVEVAAQRARGAIVPSNVSGPATKEDLGEQTIEGVRAHGTRSVTVIPAGSSIGNLNEIKILSEQWFSPDLEVLVMTKHSDPRVGETIYKLTNIVRAQPDPNLFTVPGDYTLRPGRGGRGGGDQ